MTIGSNMYVLSIGIGAYQQITPLGKTTTDARDVHDILAQMEYPQDNMVLLLDQQATKSAISTKLAWLADRVGPEDIAVIFFSGHGVRLGGGFHPGEYLCPVEATVERASDTCISGTEFTSALRSIRAGRLAVFLDACHAGGVGEPKDPTAQVKAGLSEMTYDLLMERGRVIIAACRPEEVSWEIGGMRNGLFTHYLIEAIRGRAARLDGTVWMSNLFGYIYEHVSRHGLQHPFQKMASEDFVLTTVSGWLPALAQSTHRLSPTTIAPTRHDLTIEDQSKLREVMHAAYDRPTFEILCKDLGLDFHDLRGETLRTKIMYLIDSFHRQRQDGRLVGKVLTDHPYLAAELS